MSGRCIGTIIKLFGEYIKSIYKILILNIFASNSHGHGDMVLYPLQGLSPHRLSHRSLHMCTTASRLHRMSLFLLTCIVLWPTSVLGSCLTLQLGVDALDFLLLSGPSSLRENSSVTIFFVACSWRSVLPTPKINQSPIDPDLKQKPGLSPQLK